MAKIETLTDAQEAAMEDVKREWLAIGMSTEPANRAEAEEGMRLAYLAAGLEPPKIVIWLGSPMAGVMGCKLLQTVNEWFPWEICLRKPRRPVGYHFTRFSWTYAVWEFVNRLPDY